MSLGMEALPLLTIRNRVILPGGFLRLSIGQRRSVRLVEDSLWGPYGEREFVVSADEEGGSEARDSVLSLEDENTGRTVGSMGCVVCVEQLARSTSSQGFEFSMLVRGLCRARIERLVETSPFYRARVRRIYDPPDLLGTSRANGIAGKEMGKTEGLASALRDAASSFLSMLKEESGARSNGFLSRRTFQALEEAPPGALADVIASLLPGVPFEKQLRILETEEVDTRLAFVTELIKQKVRAYFQDALQAPYETYV
jgi:ATP-dependent Lon protease